MGQMRRAVRNAMIDRGRRGRRGRQAKHKLRYIISPRPEGDGDGEEQAGRVSHGKEWRGRGAGRTEWAPAHVAYLLRKELSLELRNHLSSCVRVELVLHFFSCYSMMPVTLPCLLVLQTAVIA